MDRERLLADLQGAVKALVADLEERVDAEPLLREHVRAQHQAAKKAGRTAEAADDFQEGQLTQAAVAWVLACVFVRFLEDNEFLDRGPSQAVGAGSGRRARWIGGSEAVLLRLARDHEQAYFREQPRHGEREYLLHVFRQVRELPGMSDLLDEGHNPLWVLSPSADGARDLLELFRAVDPESGEPVHAFSLRDAEGSLDTRFLGDLYQDLSEWARKRYALLQTPEFVEEFLLDRTLEPAIETFGHRAVTLIDPACGSGHFLLGAFQRLFGLAERHRPGENRRALVQDVLDRIAGVDLNPFAAAIARFRLLVAALDACEIGCLVEAPDFRIRVATGDSLLHGRRPGELLDPQAARGGKRDAFDHYFAVEDAEVLAEIFHQPYHVVVGNPPYIAVKDPGLRDLYRSRYASCHGKYSLVCPFLERFFDLGIWPSQQNAQSAGFVGVIVGNAFMTRSFGRRLVEEHVPNWDLNCIIDSSRAIFEGHGTPTVILLARSRSPVSGEVRAVLGIQGEEKKPGAADNGGRVWAAILDQVDHPGSESRYFSVADVPRARFERHPWSLQGGGAADLRLELERRGTARLVDLVESVGITAVTGEDGVFVFDSSPTPGRLGIEETRPFVTGQVIRDWSAFEPSAAVWLYDANLDLRPLDRLPGIERWLWPLRSVLSKRKRFGVPMLDRGLQWYEWQELYSPKLRARTSISFAFVATHNHFIFDRGGKVFNRSAPVIKLPQGATEADHLTLLGLLNSSAGCFWMKQVFFNKGGGGIGGGIATEEWEQFYEHDATKIKGFPVPERATGERARTIAELADELGAKSPGSVLVQGTVPTRGALDEARASASSLRRQLIGLQEELDWEVYSLYGLTDEQLTLASTEPVPEVDLGERAFEIVLARRVADGELRTAWFERHGSTPTTAIPESWPDFYRELVRQRIALIESDRSIGLLERPEYKRRWNTESWQALEKRALRAFLLEKLEDRELWDTGASQLQSGARIADSISRDKVFRAAAGLYRGRDDFDLTQFVIELARSEAVPYLASQRYKPSGLKKRRRWQEVWDLQRQEDAFDSLTALPEDDSRHLASKESEKLKSKEIGEIPVPPKYKSGDFKSSTIWSFRGKLDVPKERFIAYPGAEREADPTPVFGWAGWNDLERARALATYYLERKDQEGWPAERLLPLLAGLAELLPWVKQWHNDFDPTAGMGMGDYFEGFLQEEARAHGVTVEQLEAWGR